MASVSLCMIVRNEEKNIRRCLDSVCNSIDEIIIVDTGSTDSTIEICKAYNVKIIQFEWCDDFAAARNAGIEAASCDWILCLDADEELICNNPDELVNALKMQNYLVFRLSMIHYYGAEPYSEAYAYHSTAIRLFKNNLNLRFTGRIHENLALEHLDPNSNIGYLSGACIRHYGYTDDYRRAKSGRNLNLLIAESRLCPEEPWVWYHLAVEHCQLENFTVSMTCVNKSISLFLEKSQLPSPLLYKLKYHLFLITGHVEEAFKGIEKAVRLYPDYVDLRFYQGLISYLKGRHDQAIQIFSYCLILGESNPRYLILSGTGSFMALYYIGQCYKEKGELSLAKQAFRQALDINCKFSEAVQALSELDEPNEQTKIY